jgi:transcriptional regulator with XRE-family HTH domain
VKKQIGYRIRKIRESKDFSQENVAADLNITAGAYAKIERGETDPSATRLIEIASILGVDVTAFFQDFSSLVKAEAAITGHTTDLVTQKDLVELAESIRQLYTEIAQLKKDLAIIKKTGAKHRK